MFLPYTARNLRQERCEGAHVWLGRPERWVVRLIPYFPRRNEWVELPCGFDRETYERLSIFSSPRSQHLRVRRMAVVQDPENLQPACYGHLEAIAQPGK